MALLKISLSTDWICEHPFDQAMARGKIDFFSLFAFADPDFDSQRRKEEREGRSDILSGHGPAKSTRHKHNVLYDWWTPARFGIRSFFTCARFFSPLLRRVELLYLISRKKRGKKT